MSESSNRTEYKLGTLAGQRISFTPTVIAGAVGLWIILSAIGNLVLKLPLGTAIVGGLGGVVLHYFSDLWHQLGHAFAAQGTGHPMSGIRFGFLGIFSTSLYPPNEGDLPPFVHLRRALGGPLGSLVLSVIALIIFLVVSTGRSGGTLWWLGLFFLLDNFVVLTLQAFLPLGFNDGSTILHWWRVQQKQH